jgi:hypothetical protein
MPRPYNPKVKCSAKGGKCRRAAIRGGTVCPTHGGQAPQVKAKAQERLLVDEAIKAFGLAQSKDTDRIMAEVAAIAFMQVGDLYDDAGQFLKVKAMPPHVQAAIANPETVTGNVDKGDGQSDRLIRVKVWDKPKALDILARMNSMYEERVKHSGEITLGWKE